MPKKIRTHRRFPKEVRQNKTRPLKPIYDSARWRSRVRLMILRRDPICKVCNFNLSQHVDHIVAPKDRADPLAFDAGNLQGLCAGCHGKKTRLEAAR